jgi:hypothetical protein
MKREMAADSPEGGGERWRSHRRSPRSCCWAPKRSQAGSTRSWGAMVDMQDVGWRDDVSHDTETDRTCSQARKERR